MILPPTQAGRAKQNWLRAAARTARRNPRQHLGHVVALGQLLTTIKSVVKHGRFEEWCRRNLPFSMTVVRESIRAAQKCKDLESSALRRFAPSTARLLGKRGVSRSVRAKLVEATSDGKMLGLAESVRIVVGADLQIDQPPKSGPSPQKSGVNDAGRLHRLLTAAIEQFSALHISVDPDPEAPSVFVTGIGESKQRRAAAGSLVRALAVLVDQVENRTCSMCRRTKPESAFPEFQCSFCRQCNNKRLAAY